VSKRSNRVLKNIKHQAGYLAVCLCVKGVKNMVLVHRLVGQHFLVNHHNKPCINHKNGIKTDNHVDNIEWVTYSENLTHAYETKLNNKPRPVASYTKKGELVKVYQTARAAEIDGFQNQNISHCCKGKRKHHKGLRWSYYGG
jgi:hypothetical protein